MLKENLHILCLLALMYILVCNVPFFLNNTYNRLMALFMIYSITAPLFQNEVARAIEIREIVTSLGPAYIKLGQALSIRPDILSPTAMMELQKLCDKVKCYTHTFINSHTHIYVFLYL